ncbi:MAG: hypothetical protein GC190_20360 [Alphaproteobacteria bacterium]|nr:hypothetical protein [Alphaproteobacteria bacterium]
MEAGHQAASASARLARIGATACALAMLALAAWLDWKHAIGTIVALDSERTLTLTAFLVANATVLFLAAQPARFISRPLGLRTALGAAAAASVNAGAAAFFLIDAALAYSAWTDHGAPSPLLSLLVPAAATLALFVATLGAPPLEPDEISDDDITEAALILTESQRRWSWKAVFEITGYMMVSRTGLFAVYFFWFIGGMALFDWLSIAFLDRRPLTGGDLQAAAMGAVSHASDVLQQGWIWTVFALVAILPALFILSAAVWYRFKIRRERTRLRTLSQSPIARLMTPHEIEFLQRKIERPLLAQVRAAQQRDQQRGVS